MLYNVRCRTITNNKIERDRCKYLNVLTSLGKLSTLLRISDRMSKAREVKYGVNVVIYIAIQNRNQCKILGFIQSYVMIQVVVGLGSCALNCRSLGCL